MTTWNNQAKNSTNFANLTKNATAFTNTLKSDVISTMAGKVGYGMVGQAKVGAATDSYGILTSWANTAKS